ncbi:MAG TPA: autotransporter-associated beta strand repeat-containing protein [Chthoniobacterales bacterium]|nr:autotransporter-associated beta strand repeat-containing protein [Chthoniobacterales bacterium]
MTKYDQRVASRDAVRRPGVVVALSCAATLAFAPALHATITWSGGTNTIGADQLVQDNHIIVTGGNNSAQGAAGPPAGTNGGILQLNAGGTGFEITGASVMLNADNSSPGKLNLADNLTSHASSVTSGILNAGAGSLPGTLNLSSGTRTISVENGTVPGNGADLHISARIDNGGITKIGAGILALSGANIYPGGTSLSAGTLYINSATALGTGDLTIAGANTAIDNRSGGPLTLTNNNPLNITGGNLTFIGTNDLNFGTGFSVIANADRTINIVNSGANFTIGGIIGDNGQHRALTKTGAGTLTLAGDTLYTGGTVVNDGTLQLTGSTNSGVGVSSGATFVNSGSVGGNVSVTGLMAQTGDGMILGSLVVNNGGAANVNGGTLTVNGAVTNNGTFILRSGAQITTGSGFVNNGTLDLTTAGATPANLTNNGTIIDAAVVKTKSAAKASTTVTLTIDSFTGHSYRLQKSTTTPDGSAFTTNVGSPQQGSTGNVLTFTDPGANEIRAFYRIAVDS